MSDPFDEIAIADRLKITDRLARYSWAIDSGDLAAYLDCFTDDGVLRHPLADGSPGEFVGHDGIEAFIGAGFARRPMQPYGHQHQFNAVLLANEGADIRVEAYCMVFRHEFHRQYWPRGATWRMGTWHALCRQTVSGWKIADLEVRMWTDTAFETGTALVDRGPGMPGTRD
ncbi:MAG TPA: nuclear transport factor 2 family protein [Sphingomonadaceae bacterium]|nr:nuclear transport factor 2 family protein [Sphingomonadaceae bacterium]